MAKKKKNTLRKRTRIPITILVALLILSIPLLYWYFSIKTPNLPEPPLKDLAAAHGIQLGSHASLSRLSDKPYTNILTSQFSFLTIDGEANWNTIHPSLTQYNYTKVDKLMAFAKAHNMPVQIHHLVWGEQKFLPAWLKNGNYNKAQLLNIIHDYISNVVGHYKGKVAQWSVVNEAFSRAQHTYGLSDWWADHTGGGTTYIDDSFIWAHQADPNAKLLLNDFNNETENSISNAEYNYVVAAKARGIPIDGVGMQMHINASDPPSEEAIITNMQRFSAIGVPVYITEFDVNLNTVKGSSAYKNQLEAQITYNIVRACIESKACVSFDNFGISDKENLLKWLGHTDSHSYLFDSRYRPKPAFYSFRQAWLQP
ncbi:MAG TPA: endo-1,4-beta-xylanase [Candidatus Saccharimonadales bacterium]|nr:endo-1,4-beta-xylanase [Candidatus Saccharimonadales bacterium]